MSVLLRKQEDRSFHIREVGYPPISVIFEEGFFIFFFTSHRRPLVEWFATHNSV